MSSAFAFPYIMVPPRFCAFGDWQRFDAHENAETVGDHISGWDYDSHMDMGRTVELKPKSIIKQIGLQDSDSRLSLVVTAETGPTGYRWIVSSTNIPVDTIWQTNLRFSLSSVHLAQRLSLSTQILLAKPIAEAAPFTAHELGSRLYLDVKVIQLEGSLGRFPMEMLDFSNALPFLQASNALWYLDWDPSRPESHFLGTVLLYINSAHPEVSNLIQAAEPTILSILRCDVIRTMCEAMLQNEEFVSNYPDYEMDTVGGQVREWLLIAFSDEKPELLLSKLDSSPGRFEARIQSAFS